MRVLFGRIMEQEWDFGALSRFSHTCYFHSGLISAEAIGGAGGSERQFAFEVAPISTA